MFDKSQYPDFMSRLQDVDLVDDVRRLSSSFSVRFAIRGGICECVWTPRKPTGRESARILPAYLQAREKFFASVGEQLGIRIKIAEQR